MVEALGRGDRERALTLLMDCYGGDVFGFCYAMLDDHELAEEAHQLTFVQAFEGLARFRGRSSLRTWLLSIARHRCLDVAKGRRRWRARFQPSDRLPEEPEATQGAEERLLWADRRRSLLECLQRLSPSIRSTVLLRFAQGLSFREIGRMRRERESALQMRVSRALPVLRRCLRSRGIDR